MSERDGPSQVETPEEGTRLSQVASLTWRSFLLWMLGQLKRYRISGPSMKPTLSAGVEVLVDCRAQTRVSISVGDLVLVQHPLQSDIRMIKRVVSHDAEADSYIVHGDNPHESTDSRQFGAVSGRHLLGRVVCTFS